MRLINDESLYIIEDKRGKKRQMFTSFAYTPMSHSYETLLFESESILTIALHIQ